jgi:hypothetical protein
MIYLSRIYNSNYLRSLKYFIPVVLLFLAGCKEKFPSVPGDVIPMKKMENILIDMHISDALAETKTMGALMNERNLSQQYYLQIYKNYGVAKEDFLKSYLFYQNNPILLNKLYDDVLSEMSKRESQINK